MPDFVIKIKVDSSGKPLSSQISGKETIGTTKKDKETEFVDTVKAFLKSRTVSAVGGMLHPGNNMVAGVGNFGTSALQNVAQAKMMSPGGMKAGLGAMAAAEGLKILGNIWNELRGKAHKQAVSGVSEVAARYAAYGIKLPESTIEALYKKQNVTLQRMNDARIRVKAQLNNRLDALSLDPTSYLINQVNEIRGR